MKKLLGYLGVLGIGFALGFLTQAYGLTALAITWSILLGAYMIYLSTDA